MFIPTYILLNNILISNKYKISNQITTKIIIYLKFRLHWHPLLGPITEKAIQ